MRYNVKRLWAALAVALLLILSPGLSAVASAAGSAPTYVCYNKDLSNNCPLVTQYINPLVKLLAALVGVAVVASIIIGGIQYSSAGGDTGKVSAAKKRIRDALVALLAFALLYVALNFLIPGGLSLGA